MAGLDEKALGLPVVGWTALLGSGGEMEPARGVTVEACL
jgi:hypothetical protein